MPDSPPGDAPPTSPSRLAGVDVARAAPVIGMVMVHFGPRAEEATGVAAALYTLPRGRASLLFALLAGVSLALAARGGRDGRSAPLGWMLLTRSAILLPLGLALQTLGHGVHVILQFYALYFLVAWFALRLGRARLLACAGALTLVGPLLYLLTRSALPGATVGGAPQLGDAPGTMVLELLVTGAYPVVTWGGPLLFGVWLGGADLHSATVRRRVVRIGVATAVAAWGLSTVLVAALGEPGEGPGWRALLVDDAHSQMPLWLIGSTAVAVTTLAAGLWSAERFPRLLRPLADLGRLALTIYVLHLVLLAAVPQLVSHAEVGRALLSVAVFTALVAVVAVAWCRRFTRGPLEALLRAPVAAWPRRSTAPHLSDPVPPSPSPSRDPIDRTPDLRDSP